MTKFRVKTGRVEYRVRSRTLLYAASMLAVFGLPSHWLFVRAVDVIIHTR